MGDPVLSVSGLQRRFGDLIAVDGVSFQIAPGETYGLLGPNGAGKTTTISMIAGILTPDAGAVRVLGEPVAGSAKSLIGLVPQDIALYPDLSAQENLHFFGSLQNLTGATLKSRIAEVLEVVGLTDRAKDRIETYSGGMKRRANIAVGMLHSPKLLILDEPTVGVDPQSRNSILEAVAELGSAGMAVLYTTHYMEEAERLCDRIGIMDSGRLIAEGTRAELIEQLGEQTTVTFQVNGPAEAVQNWQQQLQALPEVSAVRPGSEGIGVIAADGTGVLAQAVQLAQAAQVDVVGVSVAEPDLEAVFLHLTGKALRD